MTLDKMIADLATQRAQFEGAEIRVYVADGDTVREAAIGRVGPHGHGDWLCLVIHPARCIEAGEMAD